MKIRNRIVWVGLVACVAVLAACRPHGKETSTSGEPVKETGAPDIQEKESAPWNTYHGASSLDGVADARLPDELSLLWRFMAGAPVVTTPVAGAGRIYFANTKGRLFAVDLNGVEVWSKTIPREATDRWSPTEEQFDAPLAFFGDRILAGSADGVLYALDAATGEIRWKADVDGSIMGSANFAYGDIGRVFVIDQSSGVLHCLDFATGKPVWRGEKVDRCDGSPGVSADVAVFGSCAAALHVFSTRDGKLARKIEIDDDSQVAGGVVVLGDMAIAGSRSGKVLEVNTKTGQVLWANTDCADEVFTTPAVNGEWVLFGAADGKVYALDRSNGVFEWSFQADGPVTSPVLAGDKVVVASQGILFLLQLADGQKLWSYPVSDEITSPAVYADMIITGCDDGAVAAFR